MFFNALWLDLNKLKTLIFADTVPVWVRMSSTQLVNIQSRRRQLLPRLVPLLLPWSWGCHHPYSWKAHHQTAPQSLLSYKAHTHTQKWRVSDNYFNKLNYVLCELLVKRSVHLFFCLLTLPSDPAPGSGHRFYSCLQRAPYGPSCSVVWTPEEAALCAGCPPFGPRHDWSIALYNSDNRKHWHGRPFQNTTTTKTQKTAANLRKIFKKMYFHRSVKHFSAVRNDHIMVLKSNCVVIPKRCERLKDTEPTQHEMDKPWVASCSSVPVIWESRWLISALSCSIFFWSSLRFAASLWPSACFACKMQTHGQIFILLCI